ncbi:MAG: hypothetical protein QW474_00070 [Candidatus Aenigmatarchaeota archaeon]
MYHNTFTPSGVYADGSGEYVYADSGGQYIYAKGKHSKKKKHKRDILGGFVGRVHPEPAPILYYIVKKEEGWKELLEFIKNNNRDLYEEIHSAYQSGIVKFNEIANDVAQGKIVNYGNKFYDSFRNFAWERLQLGKLAYAKKQIPAASRLKTYADFKKKIIDFLLSLSNDKLVEFVDRVKPPYYGFYKAIYTNQKPTDESLISHKYWYADGDEFSAMGYRSARYEAEGGSSDTNTKEIGKYVLTFLGGLFVGYVLCSVGFMKQGLSRE